MNGLERASALIGALLVGACSGGGDDSSPLAPTGGTASGDMASGGSSSGGASSGAGGSSGGNNAVIGGRAGREVAGAPNGGATSGGGQAGATSGGAAGESSSIGGQAGASAGGASNGGASGKAGEAGAGGAGSDVAAAIRVQVNYDVTARRYEFAAAIRERSGTPALQRRAKKIDPLGSFIGTVLEPTTQEVVYQQTIGKRSEIKWGDLIEAGVAIPTPSSTWTSGRKIGAYRGGYANDSRSMTPVPDRVCRMSSGPDFCAVCRRAILAKAAFDSE